MKNEIGKIEYRDWVTRKMVMDEPESSFVFGDNANRVGLGGQAKEMRGCPNAIGIATKVAPGMKFEDFFSDKEPAHMIIMQTDIVKMMIAMSVGRKIIVPSSGLGTGLSKLPSVAPRMYFVLHSVFDALSQNACPWEKPKL